MWHVFSCALQRASEKTTYRRSSRIFKTKTKKVRLDINFYFLLIFITKFYVMGIYNVRNQVKP